jgi:hypothetical protein
MLLRKEFKEMSVKGQHKHITALALQVTSDLEDKRVEPFLLVAHVVASCYGVYLLCKCDARYKDGTKLLQALKVCDPNELAQVASVSSPEGKADAVRFSVSVDAIESARNLYVQGLISKEKFIMLSSRWGAGMLNPHEICLAYSDTDYGASFLKYKQSGVAQVDALHKYLLAQMDIHKETVGESLQRLHEAITPGFGMVKRARVESLAGALRLSHGM